MAERRPASAYGAGFLCGPFLRPCLANWRTPIGPGDAGAALAFRDPSDYALAERVAALSMLAPADASPFVGFRCVRNPGANP